jgi:DNA-binding IclR family transcriptional regulator
MKSYKRIKADDLVMDILEYLSEQKAPVSGKQISAAVKVPYSTVMCHLATLGDRGLIRTVGECFEMGTGMAAYYYRYTARLENRMASDQAELKALGIKN